MKEAEHIKQIQKTSEEMIKIFGFEGGMKRMPTEHEINAWAMEIDLAIVSDSKRVREEALELTMWMSELARRFANQKDRVQTLDEMKYDDEELDCEYCEYFHNLDGTRRVTFCKGNEPYSCHKSKKEGLCHKVII